MPASTSSGEASFNSTPMTAASSPSQSSPGSFVGSGTVPGVGVPMVLVSGKLAAARVGAMVRP